VIGTVLLISQASCGRHAAQVVDPTTQTTAAEELDHFKQRWLGPAKVAPPAIAPGPRKAYTDGVVGTSSMVRAEDAVWNLWRDGTYRLFNNRSALLFDVTLQSNGSLRWVPQTTQLEINVAGEGLEPALAPDDLLLPLLQAALQQEEHVIDGDLAERTRAAGPFRATYMPTAPMYDVLHGLVAFPMTKPEQHVVTMRLTVGVHTDEGPTTLTWLFE